jgi:hypothetical protein
MCQQRQIRTIFCGLIKALFLAVLFLFPHALSASKIEKAYEALDIYDYFKAKKLFYKCLKHDPVAASFGLATIYYRSDNPFTNADSAFRYIRMAEEGYAIVSSKQMENYRDFGMDYQMIVELRSKISSRFYVMAKEEHTVLSYTRFIKIHPWASEVVPAIYTRDSLAFAIAMEINSSSEFQKYLDTYPESEFVQEARQLFYLTQFKEATYQQNVLSYLDFMAKYPQNPYKKEAEDQVYRLSTDEGDIRAFYAFIKRYPTNHNVGAAWKTIFQMYMREYSEDRIASFIADYPEYPFKDELEEAAKTQKLAVLPFQRENLFGYMDYAGKIVLEATYEQLGFFKEGLASVAKDGKFGFIDKSWKIVIPFQYESVGEFESGRTLVELDGKFGMIDRSGTLVFPIEFEDLGNVSEELIYGKKDSLYGYYDRNGNVRIEARFEEAFPFQKGVAKVQYKGKQAFIDEYGTFIVPPAYDEIDFFNDSLLTFSSDGLFGLMRRNCQVVVQPQYTVIGKLSQDRALVLKDGKVGYIDGAGKLILQAVFETFPNYLKRGQFTSGLALLRYKGKFGLVDKNGKVIVPLNFFNLGDVHTLLAFQSEKGWGYMDLSTKVLIEPVYQFAESFKDGIAIVEKNGMQGVIDTKGVELIPASFQSVVRFGKNLLQVTFGDRTGLYTAKGETLAAVSYIDIRQIDNDLIALKRGNELHYLYLPEKRIIKPITE